MSFPALEIVNQVELLAAWTGVIKPRPWDMFFLVMGRTGSGKSTFIGHCTGKNVTVGHGLYSCTSDVTVSDYHWNGRRIFLIDTPGFNDTRRPDTEILEMLATSLSTSYGNGVCIHGIIMMHPMSDNRMSGSSLRTIEVLKAMCGFIRYNNLAIVTTMWPRLEDSGNGVTARERQLEARYAELLSEGRFFGELVDRGAEVFRYKTTGGGRGETNRAAAQSIVAHLVRRSDMHPLGPLRLQREILSEKKCLGQTAAGYVVAGDLQRSHQANQTSLRQVENELKGDTPYLADIRRLKKEIIRELRRTEAGEATLQKSLQDMHRDSLNQCRRSFDELDERFRAYITAKEQELRDMETRHAQMERERVTAQTRTARRVRKTVVDKTPAKDDGGQSLGRLREEVTQTREAHSKFTGYKGQILNGATNGLAASLTAGFIAVAAAGGSGLFCTVM